MMRATLPPAALIVAGCVAQPVAPAADLLDTYWRAVLVEGQAIARQSGTREPHIVLKREGSRISGFAGCNNLAGTFQQDGGTLRFGDKLAMTRMACVGGGDAFEAAFTKALVSTTSWRIVGDQLELRDAQGVARMIFETRKDSYR
jgi:heat shock protein HslJ